MSGFTLSPTLTLSDADVFDGGDLSVVAAEFDEVGAFNALSGTGLLGVLDGLGQWLEQFRASDAMAREVPLTEGVTVGQLVDLEGAYRAAVIDNLQSQADPDAPTVPTLRDGAGAADRAGARLRRTPASSRPPTGRGNSCSTCR